MAKKSNSGLITYGEDIMEIYNRLVKRSIELEDDDPIRQGLPYERHLLQLPSGELSFLTRSQARGNQLNKIYVVEVHLEDTPGYKPLDKPSDFKKPVSDDVPFSYVFLSGGFSDHYMLIATGTKDVPIRRPNKGRLEKQVRALREAS